MRLKTGKAIELLARFDIPFIGEPASPDGAETAGSLMVAVDPASYKIMVLLSKKAVDDWGGLAGRSPRELSRDFLEPGEGAHGHLGRELARRAGFGGADQARVEKLVLAAHRIFTEAECIWVELRFARSKDGFAVARASIEVCDESLFRHPDLQGAGEPPAQRELSERERRARDTGIEYLDLEGDLGILPGGIGFGMAALDIVRNIGGSPANLMDSGGEATYERLGSMMDLLLDNPRVTVAFCCRYAGLTKADGWAKLLVQYLVEKKSPKPLVLRVAGNNEEEARRIFEEAAQHEPELFKKVWTFYSSTPADNAAREAVALAEMIRKGEDPFAEDSAEGAGTPGPAGHDGPERAGAPPKTEGPGGSHEGGRTDGTRPSGPGGGGG